MVKFKSSYEEFESMLESELGDWMRSSQDIAQALWSALANVAWKHKDHNEIVAYSFRAAGSLIAKIVGEGDYLDYYCGSKYATVLLPIKETLRRSGWKIVMNHYEKAQPIIVIHFKDLHIEKEFV
jgi:hypothetical protein